MKVTTKCHKEALCEAVELGLIGGIVAIVADMMWMAHDILVNGLHVSYALVMIGLIVGLAISLVALYNCHTVCYIRVRKEKYQEKLVANRNRRKYERRKV